MIRPYALRALAGSALALAGAFGAHGFIAAAAAQQGYATEHFTPQNFHLPEGSGCSGAVARWQAIHSNDYASGNIGLSVYRQIQSEIAAAAAACSAGRDAQARALVASSRRPPGYPA